MAGRKFTRVYVGPGGEPLAEFLPLDFGQPRQSLTEEELRTWFRLNQARGCPENDHEERIAMAAFGSPRSSADAVRRKFEKE